MIRITGKSAEPPPILVEKGRPAAENLKIQYDKGIEPNTFFRHIYGDREVKESLRDAQHGKCCFCEAKIGHISYGDVEHFRPKAGYLQNKNDVLQKPGYYWLAYEWDNLLLSCTLCNQNHKRNLFPLMNPTRRALNHHHSIEREKPLFIHPVKDNPSRYLSFRGPCIYPVRNSKRGLATIKGLGLDRLALEQKRKSVYDIVKTLRDMIKAHPNPEIKEKGRKELARYMAKNAEFSGMFQAAARDGFKY